jgi:hypothetical protein
MKEIKYLREYLTMVNNGWRYERNGKIYKDYLTARKVALKDWEDTIKETMWHRHCSRAMALAILGY